MTTRTALSKTFSLSIVTPAYNEAANLPLLYEQLKVVLEQLGIEWEMIIVDDHSRDDTFDTIARLAEKDHRVRGLRLARNSGSHTAVGCGLDAARGDCAIVLASDLQDPPEIIPTMTAEWQKGAQVVWGVRAHRQGESSSTLAFSRFYYVLMRGIVGMREMPTQGADVFLIDRTVIEALRQFRERNVSLFALIMWMGFRQTSITYDKQPRRFGRSGWNLEKKIKLVIDSITSFTYLPIRLMSYVGILFGVLGFLYAAFVIINAVAGNPPQGWSSLIFVVLIIGGIQMVMIGILGEYLWRTLDEARQRPRYLVEAMTGPGNPTKSFAIKNDAELESITGRNDNGAEHTRDIGGSQAERNIP